MICASFTGPLTMMMGSCGNTGVPSSTAHTSEVNLKFLKKSKNSSENIFLLLKYSISSSVNLRFSIYSMTCSSPAAMAKPPLSGTFLKNISKTASVFSTPLAI